MSQVKSRRRSSAGRVRRHASYSSRTSSLSDSVAVTMATVPSSPAGSANRVRETSTVHVADPGRRPVAEAPVDPELGRVEQAHRLAALAQGRVLGRRHRAQDAPPAVGRQHGDRGDRRGGKALETRDGDLGRPGPERAACAVAVPRDPGPGRVPLARRTDSATRGTSGRSRKAVLATSMAAAYSSGPTVRISIPMPPRVARVPTVDRVWRMAAFGAAPELRPGVPGQRGPEGG